MILDNAEGDLLKVQLGTATKGESGILLKTIGPGGRRQELHATPERLIR